MREHGSRLVELGYEIVPIDPGTKRCTRPGWQNFRANEEDVQKWLANGSADAGVGILARNTIAIDVDVLDEGLSKKIAKHITTTYGAPMLRVGKYPKYCIPFRVDTPFKKVVSNRYEDLEGKDHQVEVLGDGQHWCALGIHPDTKKEYRWVNKSIYEVEQENLPSITRDQCLEIIAYFEELAENQKGWVLKTRGNIGLVEAHGLEALRPRVDAELEELEEILFKLPEESDYETWLRVGLALHHHDEGGVEGLELWDRWSNRDIHKYNEGECEAKWNSFGHAKGVPITAAYILYLGKMAELEANKETYEKNDYLKNWALVIMKGEARVIRDDQPEEKICKIPTLKTEMLNARFHKENAAGDRKKLTNPVDDWLEKPERRTYHGLSFYPEREVQDGSYNMWRGFDYPAVQGSVEPWLRYIEDVLADGSKEYHDYIIAWSAHLIQKPCDKSGVALVFRGKKGSGKSFFGELLGGLFKHHWFVAADENQITGRFNAHLEDVLLLQGEEAIWAGSKRAEGVLKNLITSSYLSVEHKGINAYMTRSHVRLLLTSNEDWVVPASHDERRFAIFDVADTKLQNGAYFENLRKWYENGGASHILHYLKNYDLRSIDVKKAPSTDALTSQKIASFDAFDQWMFHALEQNELTLINDPHFVKAWGDTVVKLDLYNFYKSSVTSRYAVLLSPVHFWKRFHAYEGLVDYESRKRVNGQSVRSVKLSSLKKCRRVFQQIHRISLNWPIEIDLDGEEETTPF